MDILLRILIGSILVVLGTYFVWKTRDVEGFFGRVPFAERYFGSGGTILFYKTLGILTILVGFLWATNLWGVFLQATLGSLFPSQGPSGSVRQIP